MLISNTDVMSLRRCMSLSCSDYHFDEEFDMNNHETHLPQKQPLVPKNPSASFSAWQMISGEYFFIIIIIVHRARLAVSPTRILIAIDNCQKPHIH